MKIVGDTSRARIIAAFIDNLLAFATMIIVVSLLPETLPVVKGICVFVVYLCYFIVLEAIWSRTLGKFFEGLVVRKLDGSRIDLKTAIIRNATRLLEVNPILLGALPAGIAILSSERNQRIGDMLAGTLVVSSNLTWTDTDDWEVASEERNND
jgi:uncharacterized RDD family membrane protein YckC